MAVRLTRTNWVASTAIVLIAVQLVIRAILAFKGYFYWDDLILVGRAGTQNLFSPDYLFDDHDGHVMPAAFLVAGVITHLAPLTGSALPSASSSCNCWRRWRSCAPSTSSSAGDPSSSSR